MAEAIVSVVMEQLVSIIQLELEQEVRLVVGVRKEVSDLTSTLGFIKAVLDDAEKKQLSNKAVKVWIGALKNIMYEADDVLDEWYTSIFISQSQSKRAMGGSHTANKVLSYISSPCSCFQPVVLRRDIALRIKEIRGRLDVVARDKEQLNLIQSQNHEDNRPLQLTSSIVDVSEIHGRDFDKEIILSRVLSENSHHETHSPAPVISVVGMGGLGKTTLAQLVFKDEVVTANFELKIWVCVTEPFDLERVSKEIIAQASGGHVHNFVGWEVIHQHLCTVVKGKRFLLVLDDVWTENPRDWTPLKLSLDGGARGSRIIITSRSMRVATIVDSSYTHMLTELSDEHCWSLFRHIAFQGRSQEDVERLEEIGVKIASKCKGIPLAAKTIASLMRFKQTKHEWRGVLHSDIWELGRDFFPALLLSYHALPSHLKQCFMYTAIIPKDTEMEKDQLVKLWMAQGFARSDGGKEPEMIGGEYFDDLAMRSFFQDFKKGVDGKVTSCKMHDFLHDVAQSLTKDEYHIKETNVVCPSSEKVRHVNACDTVCSSFDFVWKNMRTYISKGPAQFLREIFLQSTRLRVLDLHGSDLQELPGEVQRLLHLRYLDLSATKLRILPETMCDLYNLQTLKLNHCEELLTLPEGIGRLSNLRHLEVKHTYKLKGFPQSIGNLSLLRTLHKLVVSGASGGCNIGELRHLNYLTGSLEIEGLSQVENMDVSKGAQMMEKMALGSLQLDFSYRGRRDHSEAKRLEGVLEGLQPNPNLELLKISEYPGFTFPFWMSSKSLLCNVVNLRLNDCRNCSQLPALGNLESLEVLRIDWLVSVKQIGDEFYGGGDISFPKLKRLSLREVPAWEDWEIPFSKFKKVMPQLHHLILGYCPKLKKLPALGRLESLEEFVVENLDSLKTVGTEFLGISSSYGDGEEYVKENTVVFPKLRALKFEYVGEWEEWNLPSLKQHNIEIMPHLCEIRIRACPKLKNLPAALGYLRSLQKLYLSDLGGVQHVGVDLVRISQGSVNVVLFPKLTKLALSVFPEWAEEEQYEKILETPTIASIMPSLQELEVMLCPKLEVVPSYMFSHSLKILKLRECPQLKVIPCLPPLLEEMELEDGLGVVSRSLISSSCDHDFPNLKSVHISKSPHSSLPQGVSKFISLQIMVISSCEFLDLKPQEDLKLFPMLHYLSIDACPVITERQKREDWTEILPSHITYNIEIDGKEIKGTKRHWYAI